MPSPAGPPSGQATVDAMVARLAGQGHTRYQLLEAIAYSCEQVIEANAGNQFLDLAWIATVRDEAQAQMRAVSKQTSALTRGRRTQRG